jgi:Protein of unknown function (DUF4058)
MTGPNSEPLMPSPFPGMDPYLEDPAHWPDVHHGLIDEIRAQLNSILRPKYVARVEERTYFPEPDDPGVTLYIPDVRVIESARRGRGPSGGVAIAGSVQMVTLVDDEFHEARVEIVEVETRSVVTVIEVLSPSNKLLGSASRTSFLEKRSEIMRSPINWVEIDLLRGKTILEQSVFKRLEPHDYRVHVSPVELRPEGRVWTIRLEDRLPTVGVPLRTPDRDAPLDLQAVLANAYERAAYDATIDYTRDPKPPLTKAQAAWAKKFLPKRRRKS